MNIGIEHGLLEPKHEKAMGSAIWLYMWLVRSQTRHNGLVLGGMPLTHEEISRRSGYSPRRVRRWLDRLRKQNYVFITYLNFKMLRIEIVKPKKWFPRQKTIKFPQVSNNNGNSHRPKVVEGGLSYRPEMVEGATKNGRSKQREVLSDIKHKEEAGRKAQTAAAFSAIGFDRPFGQPRFQEVWLREYDRDAEWVTIKMEATIQECQRLQIGVPPQFFSAKREVEQLESAAARAKYHKTPL